MEILNLVKVEELRENGEEFIMSMINPFNIQFIVPEKMQNNKEYIDEMKKKAKERADVEILKYIETTDVFKKYIKKVMQENIDYLRNL